MNCPFNAKTSELTIKRTCLFLAAFTDLLLAVTGRNVSGFPSPSTCIHVDTFKTTCHIAFDREPS